MSISVADKITVAVVDAWLSHHINNSDLPGAQICIRKGGAIILNKAYGYANQTTQQAFTTAHISHIASHSKMFTSCALHMLQESGHLSLTDAAVKYLPQLQKHSDKRIRAVSLRDLLSHRAGLFRDGINSGYWQYDNAFPSRQRLIEETMSANLIYDPNTVTKYSNFGSALLGEIIAQVTGQPYSQFIENNIIAKCGKVRIYPDYPLNKQLPFADGHTRPLFNGARKPLVHPPANALDSATGFCADAESISLFGHEFLLGNKLLSPATQRDIKFLNWPIFNSQNERYGLGVMSNTFNDMNLVGHAGGYLGFASQTRNILGTDYMISFILNTNALTIGIVKNIADLLRKIAATFNEREIKRVILSPPLFSLWSTFLFVVGDQKALQIPLDTSAPAEEIIILEKGKNGFIAEKANGYYAPGEIVTFQKISSGKIKGVNYAGTILRNQKEFQKRIEKSLL